MGAALFRQREMGFISAVPAFAFPLTRQLILIDFCLYGAQCRRTRSAIAFAKCFRATERATCPSRISSICCPFSASRRPENSSCTTPFRFTVRVLCTICAKQNKVLVRISFVLFFPTDFLRQPGLRGPPNTSKTYLSFGSIGHAVCYICLPHVQTLICPNLVRTIHPWT